MATFCSRMPVFLVLTLQEYQILSCVSPNLGIFAPHCGVRARAHVPADYGMLCRGCAACSLGCGAAAMAQPHTTRTSVPCRSGRHPPRHVQRLRVCRGSSQMLPVQPCTCWALRLAHADSGNLHAFDISSVHLLMTLEAGLEGSTSRRQVRPQQEIYTYTFLAIECNVDHARGQSSGDSGWSGDYHDLCSHR